MVKKIQKEAAEKEETQQALADYDKLAKDKLEQRLKADDDEDDGDEKKKKKERPLKNPKDLEKLKLSNIK